MLANKTVLVTPELITTIKNFRKNENIKSADLSQKLNKNTSFISLIENGRVKNLDIDIFYKIFEIIIPDEKKRVEIINNSLIIYSNKLTEEEIKKQIWMITFDLQYRKQIIPNEVVEFLKQKTELLSERGINTIGIIEKLNKNEELDDKDKYETNKVHVEFKNDRLEISIKFDLKENIIDEIIEKKIMKSNYANLWGIISTIFILEGHNNSESKNMAEELLLKYKFYTLLEKQNKLTAENIDNFLNPQDKEFRELFQTIISYLKFYGDKDADYINSKLRVMRSNIKEEPSLTFGIIGVPLIDLKNLNKENRQQFVNDFRELVMKYKNIELVTPIEHFD